MVTLLLTLLQLDSLSPRAAGNHLLILFDDAVMIMWMMMLLTSFPLDSSLTPFDDHDDGGGDVTVNFVTAGIVTHSI